MGRGADFFYLSTNCYLEISNLQIAHLANFQQIANPVIFDKWKMIRGVPEAHINSLEERYLVKMQILLNILQPVLQQAKLSKLWIW